MPISRPSLSHRFGSAWHDVAYASRSLLRSPGTTAAIVLTLSLGLGANAAFFAFLDQVFFRAPAGVAAPQDVRRVWIEQPIKAGREIYTAQSMSLNQFKGLEGALGGQMDLALYALRSPVPAGPPGSESATTVAYATPGYFPTLGVRMARGRAFLPAEGDADAPARVAVVSDAFWRRVFGGDAKALGATVTVDGREFEIVGITPPGFSGIDLQRVDLWVPLGAYPTYAVGRAPFWKSNVSIHFSAFARLKPGVDARRAETVATTAYRSSPWFDFQPSQEAKVYLRSIVAARGPGARAQELSLAVRLDAVAFIVLLMTAANVASLLLARATSRRREVAVRLALGISQAGLARLFIVESTLLALAAGAVALISGQWTGSVLRALLLPGTQFATGPLGWHVVVAGMSLSLVAGVALGLVPAWQMGREDLTLSLKGASHSGGTGRALLPQVFVGAQAALSVPALVGAALFARSLANVEHVRLGFDVPRLAFASVHFQAGERPDSAVYMAGMRQGARRLGSMPGVEGVAFSWLEPMSAFGGGTFYSASDSSNSAGVRSSTVSYVSADYFRTTGARFLSGGTYSDDATGAERRVVVNRTLAATFWPGQEAVGQCIYVPTRASPCAAVAGVVEDAMREQLIEQPAPQLYVPMFEGGHSVRRANTMIVRADPARLAAVEAETRRVLHEAFPTGDPTIVRMSDRIAPQYHPWQLGAGLSAVFGLLAVVVVALGIYSSVSYSVTQTQRDLGIRIALGARAGQVLRHVVGRGVWPAAAGAVAGSVGAIAAGRLVAPLVYGTSARDPGVVIGVLVGVVGLAVVAAAGPGWRAARVDPMEVVREG